MIQELATKVATTLSRRLPLEEREAVLGDLAECSASPLETARQLLGLVIRRWALGWTRVEPWLGVAAVAVPCGVVLSVITRWWTESAFAQVSLLLTVWFPGYFTYPGARHGLVVLLFRIGAESGALIAWSWTIGVTLRRLSHRSAMSTAFVLFVLLFTGTVGTSTLLARHGTPGTPFRTAILVATVRLALVVGPLVFGLMRSPSRRRATIPLVTVSATLLTIATITGVETAFTFGRGVIPPAGPDGIVGTADDVRKWVPWIPLLLLWPGWYSTLSRLWHRDGALNR